MGLNYASRPTFPRIVDFIFENESWLYKSPSEPFPYLIR